MDLRDRFPLQDGLALSKTQTQDIPSIKTLVNGAYEKYIERIGKPPAPMLTDYHELLRTHDVFTLRDTTTTQDRVIGAIVLSADDESVKINNLVVDPLVQGRGLGRLLMKFAEAYARDKGLAALTLYTNVKMYENLGLYPKLGFLETERRTEDGYERVFFRKDLV